MHVLFDNCYQSVLCEKRHKWTTASEEEEAANVSVSWVPTKYKCTETMKLNSIRKHKKVVGSCGADTQMNEKIPFLFYTWMLILFIHTQMLLALLFIDNNTVQRNYIYIWHEHPKSGKA